MALMEKYDIGLVLPTPPPFLRHYGWGRQANLEHATNIAEQLKVDPQLLALPLMFPAGNMFIGKFSLFAEFAAFLGNSKHYPQEPMPEDGSFLHAVERMYTALSLSRGYPIAYSLHPNVDRLPGEDSKPFSPGYRFVMPVQDSCQPLTASHLSEWLKLQAAGLAVAQREVDYLCSHPLFLMATRLKRRLQDGWGVSTDS